jgi:hypothetical protein
MSEEMTIEQIEHNILNWAHDRGIMQHSNPQAQCMKSMSELGELADNLIKGRDTRDDYGDIVVTLILGMRMQGFTLQETLEHAWDEIKDRRGHMTAEGAFVKEQDNVT